MPNNALASSSPLPSHVRVIFRGDDAGVTRGTNEALLACTRAGVIRSVAFMAPCPAFEHAVELFREAPANVVFGLHATVTCEWNSTLRWGPVLPRERVRTLLDHDGNFVRDTKTLLERANPDEVVAELRAQIHRARNHGLHLTYMDTHMVFNWLPGMQDRLDALAREERLVMDRGGKPPLSQLPVVKGDFPDFQSRLKARLLQVDPAQAYYFACHPSKLDADTRLMVGANTTDPDAVGRARAEEAALYTDPAFAAWLREHRIATYNYGELRDVVFPG